MADTKVPVTIAYRKPGTQPPLFVAGTFSHPQWVPQEMDCTTGEDGVFNFSKAFEVEPESKIQYKFRVGPGDWWVLDETAPTVTDDAGHTNNIIEAPSARETKPEDPIQATKNDDELSRTNHVQQAQPVPKLEALKEAEKIDRSATSTPEYARTAAEVADSAALVDPPTPQPETVDAVASVPLQEAADTAAEVADTAEDLDHDLVEENTETTTHPHKTIAELKEDLPKDNLDIAGFSNEPEPVPLFAHECAGLYEDDEIPGVPEDERIADIANGREDQARDDFDDPTLERFPSSRSEILATVRKVETGLNANQTANEGVPPSPVFRSRTRSSGDGPGENHSPELSPVSSKGSLHFSLPQTQPQTQPQEDLKERSLSAASLGSIAEGDEPEPSAAEEIAPIVEQAETADEAIKVAKDAEGDIALDPAKSATRLVVTVPSPAVKNNHDLISPVSDEDEAVVMKDDKGKDKGVENGRPGYVTPERATTPKPEETVSLSEPAPNTATPDEDAAPATEPELTTMPLPASPKIVVSEAEDIQPQEALDEAPSSNGNGHKDIQARSPSASEDETGSRSEPVATSSAIEDSQPSSFKKRSAHQSDSRDRSATPAPLPDNDWEAAKNGNWFSAFFRLIFVDWVGGFVSRLCGSRRKTTLVTTGVALVAIGAAWLWNTRGGDFREDALRMLRRAD